MEWLRRLFKGVKKGETEGAKEGRGGRGGVQLKKDPFPDYQLLKEVTILDIRTPEEVEEYGELPNSIHIPFDHLFQSRVLLLDRSQKYGVVDLRGIYSKEATQLLQQLGFEAVELKGGFFYLTEVLNFKPIKRGEFN